MAAGRRVLDALEVMLVTDGRGDPDRIEDLVRDAIRGGVRCVHLREPDWTGRQLAEACARLRPRLDDVDGLLLVNDRADLCAAGLAHGVHVPGHGLPAHAARAAVGLRAVCGMAAHDAAELRIAALHRLDYATLSPVFATSCKPGAAHLGIEAAAALTAATTTPVLWLGGIDVSSAIGLRARGAAGIAVRSALCEAQDVSATARDLRDAFRG